MPAQHDPYWSVRRTAVLLTTVVAVAFAGCGRARDDSTDDARVATIEELNAAVEAWFMLKGEWPHEVEELCRIPALRDRTLPAPPPGKIWIIEPETRKIVAIEKGSGNGF